MNINFFQERLKIKITFPSSSLISKLTSKTYIKVRDSETVVTSPVIMCTVEVNELLIERGAL